MSTAEIIPYPTAGNQQSLALQTYPQGKKMDLPRNKSKIWSISPFSPLKEFEFSRLKSIHDFPGISLDFLDSVKFL